MDVTLASEDCMDVTLVSEDCMDVTLANEDNCIPQECPWEVPTSPANTPSYSQS